MSIFSSAASWAVKKILTEMDAPEVFVEIAGVVTEIILDDDDD